MGGSLTPRRAAARERALAPGRAVECALETNRSHNRAAVATLHTTCTVLYKREDRD